MLIFISFAFLFFTEIIIINYELIIILGLGLLLIAIIKFYGKLIIIFFEKNIIQLKNQFFDADLLSANQNLNYKNIK